ncbi:MAG: carboxypeptidase regulatory-like domain-containing protein [Planctomycetales bacterium]|nr:carboxypeptidase regulatory-like domain-containing protein [Planctomycetales bacterium]
MRFKLLRAVLACAVLVNTSVVLGDAPLADRELLGAPPLKCENVALSPEGLLVGQVIDAQGRPLAEASVWLASAAGKPVEARSDASGRFAYKQLRGGVYYLGAGETVRMCRVWTHRAAPPRSLRQVMLVTDEKVVRGQMGPPPLLNGFVQKSKKFFAHPVGMVALGAAIATPIAIVAAKDDDPSSP